MHYLVLTSGLAALSWEVIWQIKSSLALGVSAWGTAITIAVTMGGMCLGSLLMGSIIREREIKRPLRLYGLLEIAIGLAGLSLSFLFGAIEKIDTAIYAASPDNAALVHLLGIGATIGLPAICMGATIPVLGLAARQFKTPLSLLYGLNTLGASAGSLIAALIFIPQLGILHTSWMIAAINITIGIIALSLRPENISAPENNIEESRTTTNQLSPITAQIIVVVTGFSTFALEVAWFRSLTAAFHSTTDAFAIMLSCVLISLGTGAAIAPKLKKSGFSLGMIIAVSGILILLFTPLIERFDLIAPAGSQNAYAILAKWFAMTLYVIGGPLTLLGVALPWIMDDMKSPRLWGRLYAMNALASMIGAVSAAWLLLPTIGFAHTSWIAGILLALTAMLLLPKNKKSRMALYGVAALTVAITFESGVGKTRIPGWSKPTTIKPVKVLEAYEGPEASVSAVEYQNGSRAVIIDGFMATSQTSPGNEWITEHYMAWMGHLPMLLHPNPKNALVICFGTGQTANAVRRENPESLDIVDINPRIFLLADNFLSNENVLDDPRVKTITMDGRAYIRRTGKKYDVITLEPMPPSFAGVNALYSARFYELARENMTDEGIIAQWLPFHLVGAEFSASISKTFQSVFPNSALWIDPESGTGILLGSKNDQGNLGAEWPGLSRNSIKRTLEENKIRDSLVLNRSDLLRYTEQATIITDDNQLLAYGRAVGMMHNFDNLEEENIKMMETINPKVRQIYQSE